MKDTLSELPGVASVKVDFDNKLVHCKVESDDFDPQAAIDALAAEEFKAKLVETTK